MPVDSTNGHFLVLALSDIFKDYYYRFETCIETNFSYIFQAASHIHRFRNLDENVLRMSSDAGESKYYCRCNYLGYFFKLSSHKNVLIRVLESLGFFVGIY